MEWAMVVGRKGKRRAGTGNASLPDKEPVGGAVGEAVGGPVGGKKPAQGAATTLSQKIRKAPRTAAVTLTCLCEGGYSKHMADCRNAIVLSELGIEKHPSIRTTATGVLNIEISGPECGIKADALANKMAEVLAGREGVRVTRPVMTADIRVSGFERSITQEVRNALALKGGVCPTKVEIGPIKRIPNGLCMVVAKCPLVAANAITKENRITIGWGPAKLEFLAKKPLRCYRCQEMGHTIATCKSKNDRTGACYRCGETGHQANGCEAPFKCAVCAGKGLPSNHRVGSKPCPSGKKGKGKTPPSNKKEGKIPP
ncbi:uncharacterized protein LOC112468828 [Temnothorax curvispinosus]|uniref:Uncharacterized protein LOC112468828 n=1 Tax=Temnothorax curvispinosus TaxID=300111 RepID=A0A6J1RG59_9HYME|nr:uncharacterized protein LOC112468828 [Temnothorax curvispinosus]